MYKHPYISQNIVYFCIQIGVYQIHINKKQGYYMYVVNSDTVLLVISKVCDKIWHGSTILNA